MRGEHELGLKSANSQLVLEGEYTIVNEGNETAWKVQPVIRFDQFSWQGQEKNIPAGESASWPVNDSLKLEKVLPGAYIFQVEKRYQDQNGFQFAAPDLVALQFQQKVAAFIDMQVQVFSSDHQLFNVTYTLKNPSTQDLKVFLQFLLPKELELQSEIAPVELPALGEVQGHFQFRNLRGPLGSQYVAFLIGDWMQNGERQSQSTYALFQIEKKPDQRWAPERKFWVWLCWSLILGLIGMWIFWIRPLHRLK